MSAVPLPPLYHDLPSTSADGRARLLALAAAEQGEPQPAALFGYRSAGRVVIISGDSEFGAAVTAAAELAQRGLHAVLIGSTAEAVANLPASVQYLQGSCSRLSGFLGNFQLLLDAGEQPVPLAMLLGKDWQVLDLVLDLGAQPLIQSELAPPGYLRPGADLVVASDAFNHALDELAALVGEFEKPRFFDLDPSRCAHSRSGVTACTRCLDACPADAISSAGDSVSVEPGLCQGAGVCATACPSGAINYAYPRRQDTLSRLDTMLTSYATNGGQRPLVLLFDAERGREVVAEVAARLPERVLPVELAEVGSAGLDVWLNIAARAAAVVTLLPAAIPTSVAAMLNEQLGHANDLLQGLGYPGSIISAIGEALLLADPSSVDAAATPGLPAAHHVALDDKRGAMLLAIDHLYQHASRQPATLSLAVGAPFGEVNVDDERCTLCMACVSQCPGNALVAGGDMPALRLVEQNCVQCGMCSKVCPEDAITPSPRLLFEPNARRAERTLKQEEPFLCVGCGKPFATRSMIARIKSQIGNHPMFVGDGQRRLEMCEDCRVIDMYQAASDQPSTGPTSARELSS